MQRILRQLDQINADNIGVANIRTATVVRLPFHLCTGPCFQFVDPDQDRVEIWLRNKRSIPHKADELEFWRTQAMSELEGLVVDGFLTDALIVDRRPELRQGEFDSIKAKQSGQFGPASLKNPGFRILNEVIAAHQMIRVGPYVSGLGALWPRMLSEREVIARILVEVVLVAESNSVITHETVLRLFDDIDRLPFSLQTGGVGEITDFSAEQIDGLTNAVLKLRNHAFYELRTNAVSAMLNGDSIVAIVLACAALEGAHGAFMRLAVRNRCQIDLRKFNEFMNSVLREQGFYSLVQLSVRVLMNEEERPTEDQLEKCLKGVTIRNAIMHASIKSSGIYKIRELSQSEISDGYSGIMAVYRAIESAVESREGVERVTEDEAD